MWPVAKGSTGFAWQWTQSSGAAMPWLAVRWDWCAPTPRAVVAVPPERSFGGAAFAAEPWQPRQDVVQSPPARASWQLAQVTAETVAGARAVWHRRQSSTRVMEVPWKSGDPLVVQPAG